MSLAVAARSVISGRVSARLSSCETGCMGPTPCSVVLMVLTAGMAPSAQCPSLPSSLCSLSAFVPSLGGWSQFGHCQWCISRYCSCVFLLWVLLSPHHIHPTSCCSSGNGVCYDILRSRKWPCLKTHVLGWSEYSPGHCSFCCGGFGMRCTTCLTGVD